MKSAIAILTYNRLHALQAELEGLLKHCPHCPIGIFEDCGQKDGTEAWLRGPGMPMGVNLQDIWATRYSGAHIGPNVQIFLGTTNLGVTGNSNRAIRWFMQAHPECDHLMLINDDLTVHGNFVDFYAQGHADLDVGLFCFCDFDRASPAISGHPDTYRWLTVSCRGYRVKLLPRMTGIMMSMTRKLVDTIGYYDSRFGQFGEEHPCPAESPVWMGDYTFKPIVDVRVGDTVIGWAKRQSPAKRYGKEKNSEKGDFLCNTLIKSTVQAVVRLDRPLVEVKFASGRTLRCAAEHTWLNYYGGRFGAKTYIPAEVGRSLVHVIDPMAVQECGLSYWNGYAHGLIAGDGGIDHGSVVQRTTSREILVRLHHALDRLSIRFTTSEWDYATIKPAKRRYTPLNRVLTITRLKTEPSFLDWEPATTEEWRGWLAGVYDADGYGRGFGQCPHTHQSVYNAIIKGLKLLGFTTKPQKHQIYLKGGWRELVRFWNICQPALAYKLDDSVLIGRFKTKDKVVSVTHLIGTHPVYCLKTSSGNYVIQGYASKNCDYTIRARLAGFINLDGQMQNCLDLEFPRGQKLLGHQDVETSMGVVERGKANQEAGIVMREICKRYGQDPLYRPFILRQPRVVGGNAGLGIPFEHLHSYKLADIPA